MGRKPSALKNNDKLFTETVQLQPSNGNVIFPRELDPQLETPRHMGSPLMHPNILVDGAKIYLEKSLAQEQVNQEHVHRRKNASERNKAKQHGSSVRRSERIKNAVVPTPNLKSGIEYIEDVTVSDSEKDEPDTQLEQVMPVLEPEPEPEQDPELEPRENLSEKNLDEKVNYALQKIEELDNKIEELLRSKVEENNSMHEAPSVPISYRSMYFESQKKIEALTDENRQLHGKLENALGKIEVYEKQILLFGEGLDKMKDAVNATAISNMAKATEAAVNASANAVNASASKRKRVES